MSRDCIKYWINVGGHLMNLSEPCVMGILNVTPDSFYTSLSPASPTLSNDIAAHVQRMLDEGAAIIDIGACSTRPDSTPIDKATERERLASALTAVRASYPDCILSLDTFHPDLAEWAIQTYGVQLVNDISGGNEEMYQVVARQGVPYILCFNEPRNPSLDICQQALLFFAEKVQQLRQLGAKDIILDLGFGFNKTVDENYELLSHMENFQILELPLLVGISHKSMIFKTLGITPQESLNGTTALHALALSQGANILRVHEVKEALQCINLYQAFRASQHEVCHD